MWTLLVVKREILSQAQDEFAHIDVSLQVNILVFDSSPESFDENVVQRSAPSIHADPDLLAFENVCKSYAGELRTLVAVEDLRLPIGLQGRLQTLYAKRRIQAVAQSPAQNLAAIPIHDCHQVGKALRQPNVGNISTPYLIRAFFH